MDRVYRTDLTASSEEQIVFYIDDMSPESEHVCSLDDLQHSRSLYGINPDHVPRRTHSVSSQTEKPRRSRDSLDTDHLSRRSSIHSNRSRTNSYVRPTPLGDGRRASVCKRGKSRRPSTTRRKDSIRPTREEVKLAQPIEAPKSPREIERARRHRRITMIILGTFLFLLFASILAVVVTLTHSSFYSPAVGSKELAQHRALLRKENEELLNSLNQDTSVPVNATTPP